jgi:hypothetical protein
MRDATWVVLVLLGLGCGDGGGEGDGGGGDPVGDACDRFFECASEADPEIFGPGTRAQFTADCRRDLETAECTAMVRGGDGLEGPTCGATWECPRHDEPCLSCLAVAECAPLLEEDSDEVCPETCVPLPDRTMDCSPADATCTCSDDSGDRTVDWATPDCDEFGSALANELCGWDLPQEE